MIKSYIIKYLLDKGQYDTICDDEELIKDFEKTNYEDMLDFLEAESNNIKIITGQNDEYEWEDNSNTYDLIIEKDRHYYSVCVKFFMEYGITDVYIETLKEVKPIKITSTIYV